MAGVGIGRGGGGGGGKCSSSREHHRLVKHCHPWAMPLGDNAASILHCPSEFVSFNLSWILGARGEGDFSV